MAFGQPKEDGAKRYIYKVLVQMVQMWHLDDGAKRYIYKVLVQIVQMWHLDNLKKMVPNVTYIRFWCKWSKCGIWTT